MSCSLEEQESDSYTDSEDEEGEEESTSSSEEKEEEDVKPLQSSPGSPYKPVGVATSQRMPGSPVNGRPWSLTASQPDALVQAAAYT